MRLKLHSTTTWSLGLFVCLLVFVASFRQIKHNLVTVVNSTAELILTETQNEHCERAKQISTIYNINQMVPQRSFPGRLVFGRFTLYGVVRVLIEINYVNKLIFIDLTFCS